MHQSQALHSPHISSHHKSNRTILSLLTMLLTLALGVSACKSNPAKEEQNWKRNLVEMDESIKIYPNLKGALVANRTQATEMWKKATSIGDEKARLKAMQNANGVMRQVVGPLRRIETQLETVERDINSLSQNRLSGTAVLKREQTLSTLRRDLDRSREALRSVSFQDPMQAKIFLDKEYTRSNGLRNRSKSVRKRFTNIKRSQVRNRIKRNAARKQQSTRPSASPKPRPTKTQTPTRTSKPTTGRPTRRPIKRSSSTRSRTRSKKR